MPRGITSLTPEQLHLRAQIAANSRWSKENPKPALERVRAGLRRKLEDQVDPDRTLSEDERRRRAVFGGSLRGRVVVTS